MNHPKEQIKRLFTNLLNSALRSKSDTFGFGAFMRPDYGPMVDGLVESVYEASKAAAADAIEEAHYAVRTPYKAALRLVKDCFVTQCPETTALALVETLEERARQYAKWGSQDYNFNTQCVRKPIALGVEDLESYMKEVVEEQTRDGNLSWFAVLLEEVYEAAAVDAGDPEYYDKLSKELTQVSAVALAMREAIDRRGNK